MTQVMLRIAVLGLSLMVAGAALAEEYILAVGGHVAVSVREVSNPPIGVVPPSLAVPTESGPTRPRSSPRRSTAAPPFSDETPSGGQTTRARSAARPPSPALPTPAQTAPPALMPADGAVVGGAHPPSPAPDPAASPAGSDASPAGAPRDPEPAPTTSSTGGLFGVGTLNWRGASHYTKNPHRGERPYGERMPYMVAKIGASRASIIGFQEFEPPQASAFLEATAGTWAIVQGKDRSGRPSPANAIAYQPSLWRLDEVRHVSIRYGGPIVQIPMARFTSTAALGSVWVLNTHNPANAVGGTNAMRDQAVRAQAQALQGRQAAEPGTPLLLTGDMNDRTRFKELFLSLSPGWVAANPTDNQIDWILGSAAVRFSGTVVDQQTNDKANKYTDHPFVHASVQLAAPTPRQPGGRSPGQRRWDTSDVVDVAALADLAER